MAGFFAESGAVTRRVTLLLAHHMPILGSVATKFIAFVCHRADQRKAHRRYIENKRI
jgi:hypothetical protein